MRRSFEKNLNPQWRHDPCPYRQEGEDCPVCDDPICGCGNPGWACTCAETEEDEMLDSGDLLLDVLARLATAPDGQLAEEHRCVAAALAHKHLAGDAASRLEALAFLRTVRDLPETGASRFVIALAQVLLEHEAERAGEPLPPRPIWMDRS